MKILVTGAGGFIGGHLVNRLVADGHDVIGVDVKEENDWWQHNTGAMNLIGSDLRNQDVCNQLMHKVGVRRVFHLAANMGGMGHISNHNAGIIRDNTMINVNMINAATCARTVDRFLFTSSACVYPTTLQGQGAHPLMERDVYPANPQMAYGWEKLHMEHMCRYFREREWLDTRIVRFHNTYGPYGSWNDGREKAPAALCRKVAEAHASGKRHIDVWGDGTAVRSYMYVDDCVEGLVRLMGNDYHKPMNLGSDRAVSVDELVGIISAYAMYPLEIHHIDGPVGVQWRNSDNTLCRQVLGWEPSICIEDGIAPTYEWISGECIKSMAVEYWKS